jgi:hypothetical protein
MPCVIRVTFYRRRTQKNGNWVPRVCAKDLVKLFRFGFSAPLQHPQKIAARIMSKSNSANEGYSKSALPLFAGTRHFWPIACSFSKQNANRLETAALRKFSLKSGRFFGPRRAKIGQAIQTYFPVLSLAC